MENNRFGSGSAIDDLVTTLNQHLPSSERYAVVSSPGSDTIGDDAITVGLVYKPEMVNLASLNNLQICR